MNNKKSAGPDGIPSEIVKAVIKDHTHMHACLGISNRTFQKEEFPKAVEKSKVNTARKSYRTICVLNKLGK